MELDAETWLGLTIEERTMRVEALDAWLEGRHSEPDIHTLTAELRQRVRDRNLAMQEIPPVPDGPVQDAVSGTITIKKNTVFTVGLILAGVIAITVIIATNSGGPAPKATYASATEMADRLKQAGVPCDSTEHWDASRRGAALDRVTCWSTDGRDIIVSIFASYSDVQYELSVHRLGTSLVLMDDVAGANWIVNVGSTPQEADVVQRALGGQVIYVPKDGA